MANATPSKNSSSTDTSTRAQGTGRAERSLVWQKQPSVLKDPTYKIGDGEEDYVD
ncbi:hypothetical protein D3C85_411700 [compost metagenome]|jgi:hypothetical protein